MSTREACLWSNSYLCYRCHPEGAARALGEQRSRRTCHQVRTRAPAHPLEPFNNQPRVHRATVRPLPPIPAQLITAHPITHARTDLPASLGPTRILTIIPG